MGCVLLCNEGFASIDVDVNMCAIALEFVNVALGLNQNALNRIRRFKPRPVKIADEHAQLQVINGNFDGGIADHHK